ncbi:hypothetical protein Daus18300_013412 [Diaporthe australafricana]|uniref:Uncharacterized protein n=1 Tax=Diaporthe australafricana TaxID=127596 RepID=A0ABR3VZ29_9PEZI
MPSTQSVPHSRLGVENTREYRRTSTSRDSAEEVLISRQIRVRESGMVDGVQSFISESSRSIQTELERAESPAVPDGTESSKLEDKLHTNTSSEKLKVVFSRRKRNVLYVAAIFHLPAVALTLILLGLYISPATWPLPGPSNNVLNSIQFAAKVHEGLAFGSITQIVFHRLRYELLGDNSCLDVCTEWYATTGDYPAECPSSGWRDLVASLTPMFLTENDARTHAQSPVNLTVSALVGSRIVTGSGLSWSNDSQDNTIAYATTPSDFLISSLNWKSAEIQGSEPPPQYRMRPGPPKVQGNQTASWLQPLVIVQCATNATNIIISRNGTDEHCSFVPWINDCFNIDNMPFSFLKGAQRPLNLSLSTDLLNRMFAAALNASKDTAIGIETPERTTAQAAIVHLDDQLEPPGLTAMVFVTASGGLFEQVDLCITEPSWTDSDIELVRNGTASLAPWGGVHVDLETVLNDTSPNRGPAINLGMDWINSLNQLVPVIGSLDGSEHVHFFDYIASFCSVSTLKRRCQSVFLASFLADAISRSQHIHPSVYFSKIVNGSERGYNIMHSASYTRGSNAADIDPLEEDDLEDADLYTNIPFVFSRYSYGYRLDNLTVTLAMAVLLLHVILVLAHVLIGLLGSSWSSVAWSGLGELLALGIQSERTPLLENTGAGVSESSIWRLKTAVRELESERKLQLVLFEQRSDKQHRTSFAVNMGGLIKPDHKYG